MKRAAPLACAALLAACGGGGGGSSVPPVPQSLTLGIAEDQSVSGQLTATHEGGGTLRFELTQPAAHGTASVSATGAYAYHPYPNYHGTDSFQFRAKAGAAASGNAVVSLTIAAVNDLPSINGAGGPHYLDPLATYAAPVLIADADGTVASTAVEQLAGPPLVGLSLAGGVLGFTMPANDGDAALPVAVRLSATDDVGATAQRTIEFSLVSVAPGGGFRTLVGSRSGAGFHLVILGDGFTAGELPELHAHAAQVVSGVLDAPEIAAYKPLWNVHLLDTASNQSGVDVPSDGVFRDTAFNATLDCAGIARLLCVDTWLVEAAAAAAFPAYDQLLLIGNTGIYGGAGYAGLATTTRHESMPLVAHHEFGHSYALLGDEYDYSGNAPALAARPMARLDDGLPPNITNVTNRAEVKWRHWFAVPGSGVDLFEGAFYQPHGYYRPTVNSFMRELGFSMGAVNVEAWVLAGYALKPALERVAPAGAAVATPFGQPVQFEVRAALGAPLQRVRWYVDGAEQPAAQDQLEFGCCALAPGAHTVTARVTDVSGRVRVPGPTSADLDVSWSLEIQP